MTTATFVTHLPLAIGGALAATCGRAALWGLRRFARAPLTYLALLSFGGLSVMAGSNALYLQSGKHPAPLFGAPVVPRAAANSGSEPLVIAPVRQRQRVVQTVDVTEDTGSIAQPEQSTGPTGNAEVFALQQKLKELNLFDGDVDGYYGPRTARAIRAFELAHGMRPLGALGPEVIAAIMRAPLTDFSSAAEPQASVSREGREGATPDILGGGQGGATELPALLPTSSRESEDQAVQSGEIFASIADVLTDAPGSSQGAMTAMPMSTRQAELGQEADGGVQLAELDGGPADATDAILVAQVQRGLASLGFLAGTIDGVVSEGTAKAIRNFEVYHNYPVTGEVTPELISMLRQAGASF